MSVVILLRFSLHSFIQSGETFFSPLFIFCQIVSFFQQANKTEIGHIWLKMIIRLRPQGTLHNEKFGQIFSANYESLIADFFLQSGILLPKLFWPTVRKNCSNDREKLLKFEAEGREFANFLRSLEQFVQTVKGQNNFWKQNAFLTYSWRFLRSKGQLISKASFLVFIWTK